MLAHWSGLKDPYSLFLLLSLCYVPVFSSLVNFQYVLYETSKRASFLQFCLCTRVPKLSVSMEIFHGMAMCSLKNWLKCRITGKGMWTKCTSELNVLILIQGHLPINKDHDNTLPFPWNKFTSLRPTLLTVIWHNCTTDPLDVYGYACLLEKKKKKVFITTATIASPHYQDSNTATCLPYVSHLSPTTNRWDR